MFLLLINFLAQSQIKYKEIDDLLTKNTMIDAISAIKKLEESPKDTIESNYWLRHSKASYIFYRYDDAIKSINKAIKISPTSSEFYFEKGMMLNKLDKLDQALEALEKATKIDKIGKYFYYKGIVNQQLNNVEAAQNDYQTAMSNGYEDSMLYSNFAVLLTQNSKNDQALSIINKAILLDKNNDRAYSVRSKIHFSLLEIDKACEDQYTAVKLGNPNIFNIPDSICKGTFKQKIQLAADIFASSKEYSQAINAYSKLIDNKIITSDYFLNRGYCYFQIKNYEKAESDYLKALTLPKPTADQIYDNLSLLYFNSNKFEKAILYSTKRIELNPKNHVAYIDRGLSKRKLQKYIEAEDDFNKSLQIKPDFFRAFGYRAFLYLEQFQFKKAFDDAEKSIKINSRYGYGYMVLAQAKQNLNINDFCEDFAKAKLYGEPDAEIGINQFCNKK